jgi:hypothetical protein
MSSVYPKNLEQPLVETRRYLQTVIHSLHFYQHIHIDRKVSFEFFIKL